MLFLPKLTCTKKHTTGVTGSSVLPPSLIVVFGFIIIFLMAPEILAIVLSPIINLAMNYSDDYSLWVTRLIVLSLAVYLIACTIDRFPSFCCGKSIIATTSKKSIFASIVSALFLFLLLRYHQDNLNNFDALVLQKNVENFKIDLRAMPALVFMSWAIVSHLLMPALEEMIFRGIMLNYFSQRLNILFGISISSTAFMLIHRSHLPVVLLFGVVSSALALKYRSLVPSIVLHVIYNSAVSFDALR